jgi:ATP-dependent exoDNAse (exonuclease V) alpha subunit
MKSESFFRGGEYPAPEPVEPNMTLVTKQATVSKVRSRNDAGWSVLVMDDRSIWTGVFDEAVQYGDTISASGYDTCHVKFGKQFKIEQVVSVLPKSADGQIAWLASELPSIGPERAKVLVETFGAGLWNVLALNPPELAQVPGLTPEKAAAISQAYLAAQASKEVVSKLVDLGLSITDAKRVWGALGAKTLEVVENDPYELMDVSRITFDKADLVARTFGIPKNDPRRARGYARKILSDEAEDGHCYADLEAVMIALRTICPAPEEAITASKRFVIEGDRLYLAKYHEAEVLIAAWVKNIALNE